MAQKKSVIGLPSGAMHCEPCDQVWLRTAEGGRSSTQAALLVIGAIAILGTAESLLLVRRWRAA